LNRRIRRPIGTPGEGQGDGSLAALGATHLAGAPVADLIVGGICFSIDIVGFVAVIRNCFGRASSQ
jgi:hypothetical protein